MPLFGRDKDKIKFDARNPPKELESSRSYSFVHNFQIRYKSDRTPVFGSAKYDLPVTSSSIYLPSVEEISEQFTEKVSPKRRRYFKIIDIEYKESFARLWGKTQQQWQIAQSVDFDIPFSYCRKCGERLSADSTFCPTCGTEQN